MDKMNPSGGPGVAMLAAGVVVACAACGATAGTTDESRRRLDALVACAAAPDFRPSVDLDMALVADEPTTLMSLLRQLSESAGLNLIVLSGHKRLQSTMVDFHEIPALPPIALLQAVACRYGFVVKRAKRENRTVIVGIFESILGKPEDLWPHLEKSIQEAVLNEKDLGQLGYLLGTLPAFLKECPRILGGILSDRKRPESQFLALNVMLVLPPNPSFRSVHMVYRDPAVRLSATRLLLARSPENVREMFDSIIKTADNTFEHIMGNFRDSTALCLEGRVRFRRIHLPLLATLRKGYPDDAEMLKLLEEASTSAAKRPEPVQPDVTPALPIATIEELAETASSDVDPRSPQRSGRHFSAHGYPLGLMAAKVLRKAAPGYSVDVRSESLETVGITTLSSGHVLPPVTALQALISRHGAITYLDREKRQIVIDLATNVLGPLKEAWPRVDAAAREAADSEDDIGKLSYYLAALRLFHEEGGTERILDYTAHPRPLVRYLAVLILATARPRVGAPQLVRALIDRDKHVARTAARALLQNTDPQEAAEVLRILAGKGSTLSGEFRDGVRTAVADAIRRGVPVQTGDFPIEDVLAELFPGDATISRYVARSWASRERRKQNALR